MPAPQTQTQAQEPERRMTRGEVINKLEDTARSGTQEDVMSACRLAIEYVKTGGSDNEYEDAVSFLNAAAVQVPGTKTIWTERRLREFVDLGFKHLGH